MKKSTLIILIVCCVIAYLFIISLILLKINPSLLGTKTIAVIEIEGVIIDSKDIVRQIKSSTKNPSVKGILLRVDTPGGGASASQEIYSEIQKAKSKGKKIVVSMGAVAASGGYYISCPADIIVANPATMTGSIGVIIQYPIVDELMKKLGIKYEVIKSKEHKDIGSPFRQLTDKEKQLLNEMTTDVYNQFVDAISESRKLPKEKILPYADGRIFSGRQAQSYGLVDSLGTYEDALKIIANLCGISTDPQIIKERPKFSLTRQLFSRSLNWLLNPSPLFLYHLP
jgi:protease-4